MSALYWTFASGAVSFSTSAKTLAQIVAGTNSRLRISKIIVDVYGGASGNNPALVEVVHQSSGATISGGTIQKRNTSDAETIQAAGKYNATVEPGTNNPVFSDYVDITRGQLVFTFAGDQCLLQGGTILGVRITSAAAGTAAVRIEGEE